MRFFSLHAAQLASVVLAALLIAMVGAMLIPLPTPLIDVLLVSNLAVAIIVILVSVFARDALDLSAFPTLLLVTTLFRLSLNVSTTRLILLQADAGDVVRSFGDFVVRGNYVVGAVVFLTITLIQFIVVARGSERVAEVGARFALDAMPGKQMSIDAERRGGSISADQALSRGKRLQRESEFYGAMDGAMKFVKGDAIAGLVVIAINLIGGLVVGILMQGMAPLEALEVYGLLTVGDGLVSQIPALLIATGAGIVVTRVSAEHEESSLAHDLARQLFGNAKPLLLLAVFLLVLAAVPGMPWLPFLLLALASATAGLLLLLRGHGSRLTELSTGAVGEARESSLWVGVEDRRLTRIAGPLLQQRVPEIRRQLANRRGVRLPPVGIRPKDGPGFSIHLHETVVVDEQMSPENETDAIATALSRVAHDRASDFVDMQSVQDMLDQLTHSHPALVRSVVPAKVELHRLTEVMRNLADEKVPLRPFGRILEALAGAPAATLRDDDSRPLTEFVRQRFRRQLVEPLLEDGTLRYHTLDPLLEDALKNGVRVIGGRRQLAMPQALSTDLIEAVNHTRPSILVVAGGTRPFLRELLASTRPNLPVLSYAELDPELSVEVVGVVEPETAHL